MNQLPTIARILLGLIFFVFGLNGFLHFLPIPEGTAASDGFLSALVETGYLMPLVKLVETVFGFCLLVGRFVPLSLTVLAPIVVNIFLFHAFLAPGVQEMVVPTLVLALEIFLAYSYRGSFRGVLESNAKPA